jgi:hypothetical protein
LRKANKIEDFIGFHHKLAWILNKSTTFLRKGPTFSSHKAEFLINPKQTSREKTCKDLKLKATMNQTEGHNEWIELRLSLILKKCKDLHHKIINPKDLHHNFITTSSYFMSNSWISPHQTHGSIVLYHCVNISSNKHNSSCYFSWSTNNLSYRPLCAIFGYSPHSSELIFVWTNSCYSCVLCNSILLLLRLHDNCELSCVQHSC